MKSRGPMRLLRNDVGPPYCIWTKLDKGCSLSLMLLIVGLGCQSVSGLVQARPRACAARKVQLLARVARGATRSDGIHPTVLQGVWSGEGGGVRFLNGSPSVSVWLAGRYHIRGSTGVGVSGGWSGVSARQGLSEPSAVLV